MDDKHIIIQIELAKEGDAAAFRTVIGHYYDYIYRVAYKWLGAREDAEDVAQTVCVKLADSIQSYRGDAKFSSWIYRITLNAAKDYQKVQWKKRAREDGSLDLSLFADEQPDQERSIIAKRLYLCISRLSEKMRMAVILVCAEGMSHSQAAEALDTKEGTISWRISEAKKQLHVCMEGKALLTK